MEDKAIVYKGKKPYKMVGPYLMGEALGEGTQGKVREALHSRNLRRVAIKIVNLRSQARIRSGVEELIQREVDIHKRLKHPNIIELIDHFRVENKAKYYVVMPLTTGASLQDLIDSAVTPTPDCLARLLMRQLFCALEYCHSQGVVHRDVKPSNMLVSLNGTLLLCDFGVADKISLFDSDACSKSRGSPAFQSPEMASGMESFSGFKVDAWAAGKNHMNMTMS